MQRTVFDQAGKQVSRAMLESDGALESDAESSVETQRIDVWFTPDPGRPGSRRQFGLFGRLTDSACALEFFHCTPDGPELATTVIKHGNFRRFLSLRKPPPPPPVQWVISSGRPNEGIHGLCFHPARDWPPGIYQGPSLLWTRLLVVNELPVTRDTLLLRLLGAGRVLRQAIQELQDLPDDAPERLLVYPVLVRLRLAIPPDPIQQTTDQKEFLMTTQDIVETWRQKAIEEGEKRGLEKGEKLGLEKGVKQEREEGRARALIELCELRFGAMPDDLRAVIQATRDEATLRGWFRLAATRSSDELIAAIRRSA